MKKKRLSTTIVILMILAGLSLVLYPTVSDYMNTLTYRRAIADYKSSMGTINEETYEDLLVAARAYNEKLRAWGFIRLELPEEELAEYESLLDFTGTGIMGYVEIPKINVSLPIYHGTSEAVLQRGVGHLEGSSLPIGGEGTHSVLSGHRGLPSSKIFTNIDQLVVGDTFTVRVLREVLTYEVDNIQTVLPYEVSSLRIEPDEDYCTLLTCTPYGVNTHRLLVRGHRVPTPQEEEAQAPAQGALGMDGGRLFGFDAEIVLLIAGILVFTLILLIVLLILKRRRRRAKLLESERERFSK